LLPGTVATIRTLIFQRSNPDGPATLTVTDDCNEAIIAYPVVMP
jgi:hypothetical protein